MLSGKTGHLAIKHDCRLTWTSWVVSTCVPVPFENAECQTLAERKVVALDLAARLPDVLLRGGARRVRGGRGGFGRIYHCEQLDQTIALQAQRPTTPFVQACCGTARGASASVRNLRTRCTRRLHWT